MAGKINTIEALRDHALTTLEKLSNGQIDTTEAGVTGKLCESVISTVKAQLEYARMIDEEPQIPFMQQSHNGNRKHWKEVYNLNSWLRQSDKKKRPS